MFRTDDCYEVDRNGRGATFVIVDLLFRRATPDLICLILSITILLSSLVPELWMWKCPARREIMVKSSKVYVLERNPVPAISELIGFPKHDMEL